jgi:hypothetical protein
MRKLSEDFLHEMTGGFLKELTEKVRQDRDLNLEIRNNYINVYFKGHSLLKLEPKGSHRYRIHIHPKFTEGKEFHDLVDQGTTNDFIKHIPLIKEKIIGYRKPSIEIEYEQMIIRANNYEPRNNSEYYIVDRQHVAGKRGRFDLTGFYWPRRGRRKGQLVAPYLMEIKFALNQDIRNIDEQMQRYYLAVNERPAKIAEEIEILFKQKLELGLFNQPANRLAAMKTLKFAREIDQFQFVLILIDYNPNSKLFDINKLSHLDFYRQIKILKSGFCMWDSRMKHIE